VRVQRLITFYSVCVIELTSRRGQILGSTSHPDAALMWQIVRNLTVADSGGFALLICDRDAMWSAAVRARLQDAGLRVIQTPYRTPNANAERFARSIKEKCLSRLSPFGEGRRDFLSTRSRHRAGPRSAGSLKHPRSEPNARFRHACVDPHTTLDANPARRSTEHAIFDARTVETRVAVNLPRSGAMPEEPHRRISIQGRVTVDTSGAMRRTIADALRPRPRQVFVDFSGVTYVDTSGLATLLEANRIARQQSTRLVLEGLHDQPRELLRASRIDHLLDIADREPIARTNGDT
jgi:anti-sigma B factor antagonist